MPRRFKEEMKKIMANAKISTQDYQHESEFEEFDELMEFEAK